MVDPFRLSPSGCPTESPQRRPHPTPNVRGRKGWDAVARLAGRGIGCGGMLGWQAVSEMGGLVFAAFGIPAAAPPTPLDSARMLPCCCVSPGDAGTVWGARALPPSFSAPAAVSGDAPIAPWLGLPPPPPACAPACKRSGPGGRRGSRTWLGPIPVAGGPFPSPLAARSPPPPSTLPCMLPPPPHTACVGGGGPLAVGTAPHVVVLGEDHLVPWWAIVPAPLFSIPSRGERCVCTGLTFP